MGASALKGIGSLASSAGSGKGGGGSGGLTPEQMAALQFGQQQEDMRLTNFYADAGIPNSSGLAYDIGSTGLQTAAQGAQLAQGNQALQAQQAGQLGNLFGQLGTSLGGQSNPDTSNLGNTGSLSSQTV